MRALVCVITAACLALAPSAAVANPTYDPHAQAVVVKTKVIGVPVGAPYVYSVGGGDPEEVARKLADEVMRRFKKEFEVNPPAGEAPPAKGPVSREDFDVVRKGNRPSGLDGRVLALFNAQCVQCHKPGQTKPGVQLFTQARGLFVDPDPKKEAKRRQRIYDSVDPDAGGEMPKNRPSLTPAERALLKEWLDKAPK